MLQLRRQLAGLNTVRLVTLHTAITPSHEPTTQLTKTHSRTHSHQNSGDHTVKITSCHTGTLSRVLTGHRRTPWVVRFHPRCPTLLASGSLDHEVRLWDAATGQCLSKHTFGKPIASLAFHVSADVLAIACGHKLYMWEYKIPGAAPVIVLRTRRSMRAVHFHPHGLPTVLTAEVQDPSNTNLLPETLTETTSSSGGGVGPHLDAPSVGVGAPTVGEPSSAAAAAGVGTLAVGEAVLAPATLTMPRLLPPSMVPIGREVAFPAMIPHPHPLPPLPGPPPPPPPPPPTTMPSPSPSITGAIHTVANVTTTTFNHLSQHQHQQQQQQRTVPENDINDEPVNPDVPRPAPAPPTTQTHAGFAAQLAAAYNASMWNLIGEEQPPRVRLRLWHFDAGHPATELVPERALKLEILDAVLCSEMGVHFSPCGKYLAATMACRAPVPEATNTASTALQRPTVGGPPPNEVGAMEWEPPHSSSHATPSVVQHIHHHHQQQPFVAPPGPRTDRNPVTPPGQGAVVVVAAATGATTPTTRAEPEAERETAPEIAPPPPRLPTPPQRVIFEIRVVSMEGASLGEVVRARRVRAAHCLTSVQFSPTGEHLLLAYGKKHSSLLRSLVMEGGTLMPLHTILEVIALRDMGLVRVLPSVEDEINAACFHPIPGVGLAYGTKEGKLRILRSYRDGGGDRGSGSGGGGRGRSRGRGGGGGGGGGRLHAGDDEGDEYMDDIGEDEEEEVEEEEESVVAAHRHGGGGGGGGGRASPHVPEVVLLEQGWMMLQEQWERDSELRERMLREHRVQIRASGTISSSPPGGGNDGGGVGGGRE